MAFALTAVAPKTADPHQHQGLRPLMLVRMRGRHQPGMALCGAGWQALGVDPARLVIVEVDDRLALLRAALEGARCPGLDAVVVESWGRMPEYDLTASRRLVLAAEKSGVAVVMMRGDAPTCASAAHTRWQVRSAPSQGLEPVLHTEVLRNRGGPVGTVRRLAFDGAAWSDRTAGAARGLPVDGPLDGPDHLHATRAFG